MKTKRMTTTALLTALAIIIPLVMPVKAPPVGPFTATLASHTPLIIAMFISPWCAIIVSLGSALGFLFAYNPIVSARAAMHVIFVLVGALMLRKQMNLYLVIAVTLVLHTLSDMITVYVIATGFGMTDFLKGEAMDWVQIVIAIGTSIHHLVDFAIALVIVTPLKKAFHDLFVPYDFGLKRK